MTVIGLTGPTGSGKTTALHVLEGMGFTAVDCDALYYELLRTDQALRGKLREAFGDVFLPDGQLDRQQLGRLVFGDKKALDKLNAIVFPTVTAAVREKISICTGRGLVVDAINLMESGLGALCGYTVAVIAPAEVRVRRIMERDGISEDYARSRVAAQKEDGFFRRGCRHVLENGGDDPAAFAAEARALFRHILSDPGETGTKE